MSALNDNGLYPWQQAAASCSGALMTSLLMTPLDVIKVRMQGAAQPYNKGNCFLYSNGLMDHLCACINNGNNRLGAPAGSVSVSFCPWYARPFPATGSSQSSLRRSLFRSDTLDAGIKIARAEGITSLWSGLPPTLIMAVPATVMYFTMYDNFKYTLKRHNTTGVTGWEPMLAGTSARFVVTTAISPIEMIRTKAQSERLPYSKIFDVVRLATAHGGLKVLWQGWWPTVLRDVPFSAVYWTSYEEIKKFLMLDLRLTEPTFLVCFSAGALAGSLAAVITLPFDVVKTQRQIIVGEQFVAPESAQQPQSQPKSATLKSSTFGLMRDLYKRNGMRALFTGLGPRLIKVTPACAIMIGSYEAGKKFFRQRNIDQSGSL